MLAYAAHRAAPSCHRQAAGAVMAPAALMARVTSSRFAQPAPSSASAREQ